MTTEELSILITIFVSVGLLTFFISTLIEQYHHRKDGDKRADEYKGIQGDANAGSLQIVDPEF